MFDPGLSVMDLYDLYPEFYLDQGKFYQKHRSAMWHCKPCWRLIHKTAIADSNSLPLAEQMKLLQENQRLLTLRAFTTFVFNYHLKTGKWLFPEIMTRCSDKYMPGRSMVAGHFRKEMGIQIYDWREDPERQIHVVAEEKPLKG
jgi:hypothetical protein